MTRRRLAVLLLTGGAALALGVAAWPFLYARLVAPLALLSWLLLRLFVLSLDERLVWLILTGAVPVALLLALRERIAASPTTAVRNPVVRGHPVESGGRSWRSRPSVDEGGERSAGTGSSSWPSPNRRFICGSRPTTDSTTVSGQARSLSRPTSTPSCSPPRPRRSLAFAPASAGSFRPRREPLTT